MKYKILLDIMIFIAIIIVFLCCDILTESETRGIFGYIYDEIITGFHSMKHAILGTNDDGNKRQNKHNPYAQGLSCVEIEIINESV